MHNETKTNTELPKTMGSTLNNKSTTTEPPPKNGQQPKPTGGGGGHKCILLALNICPNTGIVPSILTLFDVLAA